MENISDRFDPKERMEGTIISVMAKQDTYEMVVVVPKVKFDFKGEVDQKKLAEIRAGEKYQAYREDFFIQMACMSTGRIVFKYVDRIENQE